MLIHVIWGLTEKNNKKRPGAGGLIEIFNLDWNFQSRLKISISIESFNLDWKLQSSLEIFNPRLKSSISIENFNLRLIAWKLQSTAKILNFFNPWALWVVFLQIQTLNAIG